MLRGERRLADLLLEHPSAIVEQSATELARRAASLERRPRELLGYATAEPYGVVEAGRLVSLRGAGSADLVVRLLRTPDSARS